MWSNGECETVVLRRGSHDHPRFGACLLELVGALPGGPWSDRPAGVGPALAHIGRLVNDLTSDSARRRLLAMAPWLVGAGVEADRAVATLAGQMALGWAGARDADRLARWLGRLPQVSVGRQLRGCARVLAAARDGDELLRDLLIGALNISRGLDGLGRLPDSVLDQREYPSTLPLQVGMRSPDGAESTYFHCSALWMRWPEPLRESWVERSAEVRGAAGRL